MLYEYHVLIFLVLFAFEDYGLEQKIYRSLRIWPFILYCLVSALCSSLQVTGCFCHIPVLLCADVVS